MTTLVPSFSVAIDLIICKLADKKEMHNIPEVFEFWPDWTTDNKFTSPGASKNTHIRVIMGKMVSTFTYLRTIQNIFIQNVLMTCWLSGERSLPFWILVLILQT